MMLFRLTIHKSKFLPLLSPHLDRWFECTPMQTLSIRLKD
jgi:hypothetical protein